MSSEKKNDHSSSNQQCADFTFQYSPEMGKAFTSFQAGFPHSKLDSLSSVAPTHLQSARHFDDCNNNNTQNYNNKLSDGLNDTVQSQVVNKNKKTIQPFFSASPNQISSQSQSDEEEGSELQENKHNLQNYLKMLALKGDQISIETTEFDENESDNRSTRMQTRNVSPQKTVNGCHENQLYRSNTLPTPIAHTQNNFFNDVESQNSNFEDTFKQNYSIFCRVCKKEGLKSSCYQQQVINPCACQGNAYWAHAQCIEREIRNNLQYFLDNPTQEIGCSVCMSPYQLFLTRSLNCGRYKELMPCFLSLIILLAFMVYFLVQFIEDISTHTVHINNALVNLYIFIAIIFLGILLFWITLKNLQMQSLKVKTYFQQNTENAQTPPSKEVIIQFLKESQFQYETEQNCLQIFQEKQLKKNFPHNSNFIKNDTNSMNQHFKKMQQQ